MSSIVPIEYVLGSIETFYKIIVFTVDRQLFHTFTVFKAKLQTTLFYLRQKFFVVFFNPLNGINRCFTNGLHGFITALKKGITP